MGYEIHLSIAASVNDRVHGAATKSRTRCSNVIAAASTAIATRMPDVISPNSAMTMARNLFMPEVGRNSPYSTVSAVMKPK